MSREITVRLGLKQARQAAKSMEFMRRNLERIAVHLPKDRHVRAIYRQLVYDNFVIFVSLHDVLEITASLDVAEDSPRFHSATVFPVQSQR